MRANTVICTLSGFLIKSTERIRRGSTCAGKYADPVSCSHALRCTNEAKIE